MPGSRGSRIWPASASGSGRRARAPARAGGLGHPGARRGADGGARLERASFAAAPPLGADRLTDALCLGEIDAFLYAIGHPALAIQEATTACDARLVPIAGSAIDELVGRRPDLRSATIPGGLYRGNPGPVASFGVGATLVAGADLPDERVGATVEQIFADFETLRGLEPVLTALEPEAMVSNGLTAPLHPGAEAYYRARGWIE